MKGILIKTNLDYKIKDFHDLDEIRNYVDGWAELVRPRGLPNHLCMIVDEEGLLKHKDLNLIGSYWYETHKHGSPIVGDIVLIGKSFEGDFISMNNDDLIYWENETKRLVDQLSNKNTIL